MKIIKGDFIDTPDRSGFRVQESTYLLVAEGVIKESFQKIPDSLRDCEILDYSGKLIIPSFIDIHVHGPQFIQRGNGLDLELLEWLQNYTFPSEIRFADPQFAQMAYAAFVQDLYDKGSLRSSIYGTIHKDGNLILADELQKKGLIAFVGKINMDSNSPEGLKEETEISLRDTKEFIEKCQDFPNITPILTPRFAPSCSVKLMTELGEMADKYHLPVQTHLSENRGEVELVKKLFPQYCSYNDVYEKCGLFKGKGILLAHGIYLNDEELDRIRELKGTMVHCPEANLNLASGIMPVTAYLDRGLSVGLGSDVGAGHSLAMNHVLVRAVQSSKILSSFFPENRALSLAEAFYMTTRGNGEFFGNCGTFEKGMSFDALVIEPSKNDIPQNNLLDRLNAYLYTGDDRNISQRILEGELI